MLLILDARYLMLANSKLMISKKSNFPSLVRLCRNYGFCHLSAGLANLSFRA
jgi:hypothetical protein